MPTLYSDWGKAGQGSVKTVVEAWSRIHIDVGAPAKGRAFIIVVWPIVGHRVPSSGIIFHHFGPPESIVTFNGSQFTSTEFAKFCSEFGIVHLLNRCTSAVPQSNGQAERMWKQQCE